ncbi:MAG: RHS repeat-associated core domain-containing protein [Cryomorphaceae bacterium]|nr:RHS repeat-associated core domain-containing protein [Cryomorphaceae bacterium]
MFYSPFGEAIVSQQYTSGRYDNPHRFNAKELDPETGLYYYGARFYNPKTSIWLSVDPLADHPDQTDKSPYAAMWNNPIRFNDPDGRCPECEENVIDPTDGQSYISTGGAEYIFGNGEWTRQGGALDEVVVTPSGLEELSQDANSGNGETQGVFGAATPIALTLAAADGPIPFGDIIGAGVLLGAATYDLTQRKYITYTLTNPVTGQIYAGRASGFGDPQSIMMNRFSGHHMRKLGFGKPQLDRVAQGYPVGYYAIRGREQNIVDAYGGIGSPIV